MNEKYRWSFLTHSVVVCWPYLTSNVRSSQVCLSVDVVWPLIDTVMQKQTSFCVCDVMTWRPTHWKMTVLKAVYCYWLIELMGILKYSAYATLYEAATSSIILITSQSQLVIDCWDSQRSIDAALHHYSTKSIVTRIAALQPPEMLGRKCSTYIAFASLQASRMTTYTTVA